jgi:HPt (histidine-containing phosphotransfer) domain-containing protein
MTANAMAGDREKALATGMNDHVAKPIDVKELFEVLDRWIKVPEARRSQESVATHEVTTADQDLPGIPGIDTVAGVARVGGSIALYRKILETFRQTQADAPARIRAALAAGDQATAQREAHTLKGVSGNIGADAVQAAAARVEAQIKQGIDTESELATLERTLGNLITSLSSASLATTPAGDRAIVQAHVNLIPLLDRLERLLQASDVEASDVAAQIDSQLEDGVPEKHLQAIRGRIDDFEFEDALVLLGELRDMLALRDANQVEVNQSLP